MALVGERAFDDEAFWRTPLGRVIAWHVGFPRERVQTSLVGTLLGTSRQYGYRAVVDLDKELRDGSVTVPSEGVRRLLWVRQRALTIVVLTCTTDRPGSPPEGGRACVVPVCE
jgi:hypothetical protein